MAIAECCNVKLCNCNVELIIIVLIINNVSTDRGRDTRPSERVIHCVFVWARPNDHFCLMRYPRGQLSFPTDISHGPALQFHSVTQQFLQRRVVTTLAFRFNSAFNPRDLYYQGYKNNNSIRAGVVSTTWSWTSWTRSTSSLRRSSSKACLDSLSIWILHTILSINDYLPLRSLAVYPRAPLKSAPFPTSQPTPTTTSSLTPIRVISIPEPQSITISDCSAP